MTVEAILAGFVGLIAGVLIALWFDSQTLMRRLQDANIEKQKMQSALQKSQIQQRAAAQQIEVMKGELKAAVEDNSQLEATIARQLAEIEASREQLQTTIRTNETLRGNLQEAQVRLEEVEGLQLEVEEKLTTAVAENNRLLGDVQLMEAEFVTLEAQIEKSTQTKSMTAEIEQKIIAAEAQLAALETEKDAAKAQLDQVELANVEQKAQIEGLMKQLQDTEKLRQQLTVAHKKLQTADSHIETLQSKMDDVQTKMNYSGKSQLQLIRGIGPTYGRRLNEFGIQTFADLAECDAEQIADIIKKKHWQVVNISDWIDEAKALSARLTSDS
jgi:predicted flap endonuclease-1-like 5' DNA nuclease